MMACGKGSRQPVAPVEEDPCTKEQTGPFDVVFPLYQEEPAWSQQGLIAYVDYGITCVGPNGIGILDPSLAGIWVLDPATGQKHRAFPYGESPAWSPDGSKLAFEYHAQIGVVNADGTAVRQITSKGHNFRPVWHPDGKRIAFESDDQGTSGGYQPWIINLDGSNARPLCPYHEADDRCVGWNSDGTAFLHARNIGARGGGNIVASDTSACATVRLTANEWDERHPKFSPSDQSIAFTRIGERQIEVWVMAADGTNARQLTRHWGMQPSWSPDGAEIAYTRADQHHDCPNQGVIWVINVQTGEEHQLTYRWSGDCP